VTTLAVTTPREGVTLVRLQRPDRLNALTLDLLDEVVGSIVAADRDPATRCIVLTGSGRAFCAGLDLDAIERLTARGRSVGDGLAVQEAASDAVKAVRACATPVIAAVNGLALGMGLALGLAADLRIAGPLATFETGVQRLGLSGCDVGMSWMLPRVVGASVAHDMMLTARRLTAEEALRHGLVSRLADDVDAAALDMADELLALSPLGVRLTKQTMWATLAAPSLDAAIELENRTQVLALQTDDFVEAATALRARATPTFRGR
jgi:enoyl-CoA hydratase